MSEIRDRRSNRFAQLLGLELKANFAREETSQAEVAEKLGHSKSGYSRWLNAKPSMPLEALLNTCELIGVDPRDVIDAAYKRLIDEMGKPKASAPAADISQLPAEERTDIKGESSAQSIRDMAADPSRYNLAANRDSNKLGERDVDDYGA
ncbi:MAG: helix-turn-helix transcriptional regulator [Bifidobacterium sp.]|jgi:transcriptional regulator with XRE-family HTH domain